MTRQRKAVKCTQDSRTTRDTFMQSPSHNRLFEHCEPLFAELSAGLDFATLRLQRNVHETLSVQRGVVQPPRRRVQCGVMLTVVDQGGIGYAATADLSATGLQQALQQARHWADLSARHGLFDAQALPRPAQQGEYHSTVQQDWHATPLRDKLELLRAAADALPARERPRALQGARHLQRTLPAAALRHRPQQLPPAHAEGAPGPGRGAGGR